VAPEALELTEAERAKREARKLPDAPAPGDEPEERVVGINVPVVPVMGAHVDVHCAPDGARHLMIGPVVLALPLSEQGAIEIAAGLVKTQIAVAPAGALAGIEQAVPTPLNREQRRAAERAKRRR
jgi:hypothetical protein